MTDSLVTIVVPVYMAEKYVDCCVQSIVNQTYSHLEIILVDDGSPDNCPRICDDWAQKDARIKVIHQKNAGVSVARNVGLGVANGEYVTFVDSDDELLKNGIEVLVNDIVSYNADVASAAELFVSTNGKARSLCCENAGAVTVFSGIEALELSLEFDRRMTACHGKIFRKQFISDVRFEEGRRINEDFYFIFQCCVKQPTFIYRDEYVYKYFSRENSASRTHFSEKYFDMVYFAEQKKKTIETYFPELMDKAICMEVSTHLFLLNVLCGTTDKKYRENERNSIRLVRQYYKKYATDNKFERHMATIVAWGLYPVYKWLFRVKFGRDLKG